MHRRFYFGTGANGFSGDNLELWIAAKGLLDQPVFQRMKADNQQATARC